MERLEAFTSVAAEIPSKMGESSKIQGPRRRGGSFAWPPMLWGCRYASYVNIIDAWLRLRGAISRDSELFRRIYRPKSGRRPVWQFPSPVGDYNGVTKLPNDDGTTYK